MGIASSQGYAMSVGKNGKFAAHSFEWLSSCWSQLHFFSVQKPWRIVQQSYWNHLHYWSPDHTAWWDSDWDHLTQKLQHLCFQRLICLCHIMGMPLCGSGDPPFSFEYGQNYLTLSTVRSHKAPVTGTLWILCTLILVVLLYSVQFKLLHQFFYHNNYRYLPAHRQSHFS